MSIELENVSDLFPLTALQQGILYHAITAPETGVFVSQILVTLRGDVEKQKFEATWDRLTERHAALRTAFLWDGLDDPIQVVRNSVPLRIKHMDWVEQPCPDPADELTRLAKQARRDGHDLLDAPLNRHFLIRTDEDCWKWLWQFHHLTLDGWSAHLLLNEFIETYPHPTRQPGASNSSPFRYADFVTHTTKPLSEQTKTFWQSRYPTTPPLHRLSVPGASIETDSGHATYQLILDPELTAQLKAKAAEFRVTLNIAWLGAWLLLLSRWTRSNDVIVGVTHAGRSAELPGIEQAVGLFINTLPFRQKIKSEQTLRAWLAELQREQLNQRDHEQTSLTDIQRWSGISEGSALFDSLFVFENYPGTQSGIDEAPIAIAELAFTEHSNYPLAVLIEPGASGASTTAHFVYDQTRFSAAGIAAVGNWYVELIRQLAHSSEHQSVGRIGQIDHNGNHPIPRATDASRIPESSQTSSVVEQSDRFRPFATIHEWIQDTAQRHSDARAVVFENESLTYAELDHAADALAARLRTHGAGPDKPVGLLIPKSVNMIVGILGILKSGAAYVPLDPDYPTEYLQKLVQQSSIDLVVTSDASRHPFDSATTTIDIELPDDAIQSDSASSLPHSPVDASALAYIIHTSGSSGRPKGVMVTHDNLVYSTAARGVYYDDLCENAPNFLLLSSISFDSSVAGIFSTLCRGGTLVIPSPKLEQDPDALRQLIDQHQVSHLLTLPTLYEVLLENSEAAAANAAGDPGLASLRVVIVAGEVCRPSVIERHRQRGGTAVLFNEYGPTEATVWCTVQRIDSSDLATEVTTVPIGHPIPGASIHLLQPDGEPTPDGFAGEIYVAGPGVAVGYRNQPELTAQHFKTITIDQRKIRAYRTGDLAARRPDGSLLFRGREDVQVKIRGHRIESDAVVSALCSLPEIHEAAVSAWTRSAGEGPQLVAYVGTPQPLEIQAIRAELRRQLPEYMVPGVFIFLPELPKLPNGKIDSAALPDPTDTLQGATQDVVLPRTSAEIILAEIWSSLFAAPEIGIHDNYFALGGDSIMSIRMVSRARQAGLPLQPGDVARYPTIAELAARYEDAIAATTAPDAVENQPVVGDVPLGPIQHWLLHANLAHPEHWNQSALFDVPADLDLECLRRALEKCLHRHDMLRASISESEGQFYQHVNAQLPSTLLESLACEPGSEDAKQRIQQLQAGLTLKQGQVIRGLLITSADQRRAQLALVIHHLVIDAVSWGILVQDLAFAYHALIANHEPKFAPKTSSYQAWTQYLNAHDFKDEIDYWIHQSKPFLLTDQAKASNFGRESDARSLSVKLSPTETGALMTTANDSYQTHPDELLVMALSKTLAMLAGQSSLTIALESHGRPDATAEVMDREPSFDFSNTVGWFSSVYPVHLCLEQTQTSRLSPTEIKSLKEHLRSVPTKGIGYGVLKFLRQVPPLQHRDEPQVLFNFLGRAAAIDPTATFKPVSSLLNSSRSPDNTRLFALEVVAQVEQGELNVNIHYAATHHEASFIERLGETFLTTLRSLIEHCQDSDAGAFTPSDFPEADLSQSELDAFLEGMDL